jgi:hypothetical protein
MAANPWKSRPNRIDIALSDGPSYSMQMQSGHQRRHKGMIVGYARIIHHGLGRRAGGAGA